MEPIFQKGEKVRVVNLKQLDENEVPFGINEDMLSYIGQIVTITSFEDAYSPKRSRKYKCDGYRYILSGIPWAWSNPMLEKIEGETEPHERVIEFV